MAKKASKVAESPDIRLVVVFSDLHSGSRRSLMPPEYTLFEEGGLGQTVKANKQQLWLYDCWQRGWEKVIEYVGADPWAWAFIGDAVEGAHRRLTELVSNDPTDHMILFDQLCRPYAELATKRFFVRGTGVHTGDTMEMKLAEKLKCEKHPDTGQWAADRWMLGINGFNLLLRHHMSVTTREYLRASMLSIEYGNEVVAAQNRHQPAPHGCVFAHRHGYDWWDGGTTFAMVCGPWQQTTRYGHTKWSPMIPQPTITVLDWRDSPPGGMPTNKTFMFTPQSATVTTL
jgi:hypothetical protein